MKWYELGNVGARGPVKRCGHRHRTFAGAVACKTLPLDRRDRVDQLVLTVSWPTEHAALSRGRVRKSRR